MPKKETTRAHELAKEQRQVSVSEFFLKNRHLLGFDSPLKALSTTVKELVDNALDAAEEMDDVLPEVIVIIKNVGENRFTISVEDNGPGIVKEQIPNVFARLLYGSKFHAMRQSRGQQGIGVSASVLYGQLTTGKPSKITSKTGARSKTHYYELQINTSKNEPEILTDKTIEWLNKKHGTKVEIELEGKYQKGKLGVDEYIKQSAISNPHAQLVFIDPNGEKTIYKRATNKLPRKTKKIKPHPYGIEMGMLMSMLRTTKAKTLQQFFTSEFSRASASVAKKICDKAGLKVSKKPKDMQHKDIDAIFKAIQQVKIIAPPTDCLSPIGEEILLKALKKEIDADFFASTIRSPAVYRGIPFQIEAAVAYGGSLLSDDLVRFIRFANKVPLQFQRSACAITQSAVQTAWKNYGLSQSRGALPAGPAVIVVHIASVWVPFTSESKEAIAHYPEIVKEVKLALQDVGRKLWKHIRTNVKAKQQQERASLFQAYIPELAVSLSNITGTKKTELIHNLQKRLKKDLPLLTGEKKHGKK